MCSLVQQHAEHGERRRGKERESKMKESAAALSH